MPVFTFVNSIAVSLLKLNDFPVRACVLRACTRMRRLKRFGVQDGGTKPPKFATMIGFSEKWWTDWSKRSISAPILSRAFRRPIKLTKAFSTQPSAPLSCSRVLEKRSSTKNSARWPRPAAQKVASACSKFLSASLGTSRWRLALRGSCAPSHAASGLASLRCHGSSIACAWMSGISTGMPGLLMDSSSDGSAATSLLCMMPGCKPES
mmetsp:Transcript_40223/g.108671  ORF Transcript_40223/g.108671 Transcript_40223/m.108671 type:complete len:208 (-) Transcript_40223:72-695(-)